MHCLHLEAIIASWALLCSLSSQEALQQYRIQLTMNIVAVQFFSGCVLLLEKTLKFMEVM